MRLLLFILFSVVVTSELNAQNVLVSQGPYNKLEQRFLNEIKNKKLVGAAVAIVKNGKIEFIKTYGVRKQGEKATIDNNTHFQIGSISKTFSATLFAVAQKQKRATLTTLSWLKALKDCFRSRRRQ